MAALEDPLVDEMIAFVRASKRGFAHACARRRATRPEGRHRRLAGPGAPARLILAGRLAAARVPLKEISPW